jgi:hypothetical protein
MPRIKTDIAALAAQERELKERLRALKKQQRAIERAERDARVQHVGELAAAHGITHIPDAILAAAFKRLADEHPVPSASASDPDAEDGKARGASEMRHQVQTPVAAMSEPVADSVEGAASGDDGKRRWPFGGAR